MRRWVGVSTPKIDFWGGVLLLLEFTSVDQPRLRQAVELFFLGALAFAYLGFDARVAHAQDQIDRGKKVTAIARDAQIARVSTMI